jgi:enamine deaminase RidA (YjgF/YER057c/UK114 family)
MDGGTVRVGDGTAWEDLAGYSRAVRHGTRVVVSGTTGHTEADEPLGDTYAQTERALQRALAAVTRLGGTAADVVRSRVYLTPGADWQQAARAHREALGATAPANTMLHVHSLIGAGLLVEVELDAELPAEVSDAVQPAVEQRPGT